VCCQLTPEISPFREPEVMVGGAGWIIQIEFNQSSIKDWEKNGTVIQDQKFILRSMNIILKCYLNIFIKFIENYFARVIMYFLDSTLCLFHTTPLSLTLTNTHTISLTLSLTHTHTFTHSVSYSLSLPVYLSLTHGHIHTLCVFLSLSLSLSPTHTHTHTSASLVSNEHTIINFFEKMGNEMIWGPFKHFNSEQSVSACERVSVRVCACVCVCVWSICVRVCMLVPCKIE